METKSTYIYSWDKVTRIENRSRGSKIMVLILFIKKKKKKKNWRTTLGVEHLLPGVFLIRTLRHFIGSVRASATPPVLVADNQSC